MIPVVGDQQVARITAADERVDQLGPRLVQQPMLFADGVKLDDATLLGKDRRCWPLYTLHGRPVRRKGFIDIVERAGSRHGTLAGRGCGRWRLFGGQQAFDQFELGRICPAFLL